MINKLYWFYMFFLTINNKIEFNAIKKLYKVNKGKFEKIIINVIDNYKSVL
jgi:hypothetical protein